MELELNGSSHVFYDTGARLSASREQTQEQVVPDARPDILRIVAAYGSALVGEQSLRDGRAEVSGVVRAAVLYLPENGSGVEHVALAIPFAHAFEAACEDGDLLFCTAELEGIDARTVNPRKVLVRAGVRIGVRVLRRREVSLPESAAAPEKLGVRLLERCTTARVATAALTKQFSITDTLELGGAPAVAELILARLSLSAGDYNIIGRRVVFKALAAVDLLYRSTGGVVCTHRCELPFSQLLEPEGADEGTTMVIRLRPCDISAVPRQEDGGRSCDLSFTAEAQAVAYAKREFAAVADLYSTAQRASVEIGELELETLCDRVERRSTVRLNIETGSIPRDAEDAEVCFISAAVAHGECGSALECSADVQVRYTAEDGLQYQARARTPIHIELGCEGEPCGSLRAENLTVGAAAAGGVDVRFDAVADVELMKYERIGYVRSATLEEYGEDAPARPSVVLRYPVEGESMWQIAKRYLAAEEDIRAANGLGPDDLPAPDRLMLIPKRR